jgi:S1-C subfamily serine protease
LGGKKIDYPSVQLTSSGSGQHRQRIPQPVHRHLDYPNKTIYLDPVSTDGTVAAPPVKGASIGWDGTKAIVGGLAVGGPADKAGLKLGETVTAVDGTPVTTRDEFCASTTGPDPKTITTTAGTFDAALIDNFFTKQ